MSPHEPINWTHLWLFVYDFITIIIASTKRSECTQEPIADNNTVIGRFSVYLFRFSISLHKVNSILRTFVALLFPISYSSRIQSDCAFDLVRLVSLAGKQSHDFIEQVTVSNTVHVVE